MEYFTIKQAASKLNIQPHTVTALCKAGFLGRKVGNTWCIIEKEIEHHLAGRRYPPKDLPPVYDSQQAIDVLGISRSKFYRLIRSGQIVGHSFGHRGGYNNWLFTEEQLDAALATVQDMAKNGYNTVPADKYIEERNNRFYVTNKAGQTRGYKSRTIAREMARKIWKHALGVKIKI